MNDNYLEIKKSNSFIRKVFLYMILGIGITLSVPFMIEALAPQLLYTLVNFYYVIWIAQLAMVISLSALVNKLSASAAMMIFIAYSAVVGLTMTIIFAIYEPASIIWALFISIVIFAVSATYGFLTNEDLSKFRSFFMIGLISLLILSVINMFLLSSSFSWILTVAGVALFTALIAYDINRIKNISYEIEQTDRDGIALPMYEKAAIIGALNLYLDFINLFIRILSLTGKRR